MSFVTASSFSVAAASSGASAAFAFSNSTCAFCASSSARVSCAAISETLMHKIVPEDGGTEKTQSYSRTGVVFPGTLPKPTLFKFATHQSIANVGFVGL